MLLPLTTWPASVTTIPTYHRSVHAPATTGATSGPCPTLTRRRHPQLHPQLLQQRHPQLSPPRRHRRQPPRRRPANLPGAATGSLQDFPAQERNLGKGTPAPYRLGSRRIKLRM
ncbi:MAG: hypothetical protein ABSA04_02690 [Desulfobaccales bacterium]